jgi:hypothetical protein
MSQPLCLNWSAALDNSFSQQTDGIIGEREQIAAALSVVARFVAKVDPDPAHADRFFELGQVFADLNAGAHPSLVKPIKGRRARALSTDIQSAKANVAFALDALIELGEHPKEAAKIILKQFPKIENLAGPKSRNLNSEAALRKTILEWRRSLRSKRKKNDLAAELFTTGRNLTVSWIKAGRTADLRKRAIGRARYAEGVAQRLCIR